MGNFHLGDGAWSPLRNHQSAIDDYLTLGMGVHGRRHDSFHNHCQIGCDGILDHSGAAAGSCLITGHADYSSVQSQLVTPLVIREFSID